jgi:hypothetical protein
MARKPKAKVTGRPMKTIDWDLAKSYAEAQCTQEEIAGFFRVDVNTLKEISEREVGEPFSQWLKRNSENGKASLRRRMFQGALDEEKPNATMQIWLSKNYLGMQDNIQHDVSDRTFNLAYSLGK